MKIVKVVQPPAGVTRFLFRMPICFYRVRLGWLFGHRLLLLNHTGRVSGKLRRTILEVDEYDGDSYVVDFVRYASRHRAAARYMLPRVLGYSVDGSDADLRAVGQRLPFVRFVPRAEV